MRNGRQRSCCPTRRGDSHAPGCVQEQFANTKRCDYKALIGPLVRHAIAKCSECGATVVPDPLPHRCETRIASRSNFEETMQALAIPRGNRE